MKFASYETIVEMMYKHLIPTPKEQCSKSLQLGVSYAGGYVAGIFCAVVSHPADNLVSFLNNSKGASVGDVSEIFHEQVIKNIYVCYHALIAMYSSLFVFVCIAGSEEAGAVGSFHSWASPSYCDDRNAYRSTVGSL